MTPHLKIESPNGDVSWSRFVPDKGDGTVLQDELFGLRIRIPDEGALVLLLDREYERVFTIHAHSLPAVWGIERTDTAALAAELRRCGREPQFIFEWGDFVTDMTTSDKLRFCPNGPDAECP